MELVRQLQKSFYQNEEAIEAPKPHSTIIENLPLWRVQWVELPGSQNVLNVHVPHYTNMFQKILYSGGKRYFGHLYLPGGSENLDNEDYALTEESQATLTGVLMEISDYKQMDDGRLTLIVQAKEKFRVHEPIRSHSPYAIAHVEICPDEEFLARHDDEADAISNVFEMHKYEYCTVKMEDCAVNGQISKGIAVSPLSNYDWKLCSSDFSAPTSSTIVKPLTSIDETEEFRLREIEYRVWVKLDQMIQLLQTAVGDKGSVPIPSQLLGLLPRNPYKAWPINFQLEIIASKLELEGTMVGTYSSSPFVRVEDNKTYSQLRRASRLSFVIWTLVDSIVIVEEEEGFSRQRILELPSTTQRLRLAESKLDVICAMLRKLLN